MWRTNTHTHRLTFGLLGLRKVWSWQDAFNNKDINLKLIIKNVSESEKFAFFCDYFLKYESYSMKRNRFRMMCQMFFKPATTGRKIIHFWPSAARKCNNKNNVIFYFQSLHLLQGFLSISQRIIIKFFKIAFSLYNNNSVFHNPNCKQTNVYNNIVWGRYIQNIRI